MAVPVGLNVWSRLVETTFPYLDRTAAPFDSLWLPDHVQYGGHKVAEGWSLLAWALARYPVASVLAGAGPADGPGPAAEGAGVDLGDEEAGVVRVARHVAALGQGGIIGTEAIELVTVGMLADVPGARGDPARPSFARST